MKDIYKAAGRLDLDTVKQLLLLKDFKYVKRFNDKLTSIQDMLPYMSEDEEDNFIFVLQSTFKKMSRPKTKTEHPDKVFEDFECAMGSFAKTKEVDEEKAKKKKEFDKEQYYREKEKTLFTPTTLFNEVPLISRIGASRADVVIIGDVYRIRDALKGTYYEDKREFVCMDQTVVRRAIVVGIRDDAVWVSKDMAPLVEKYYGKTKYMKYPQTVFLDMVANLLPNYAIVSNPIRIKTHFYYLVLPKTMISLPFVKLKKGKITPLVTQWVILREE